MTDIIIVIERKRATKREWIRPSEGTGNREQHYRVFYEGQEIGSWACPECDAARWLIANGKAQPSDTLRTLRRFTAGDFPSMTGRLGWFADRTVVEDDKGAIRWGKYTPFPTQGFGTGRPPTGSDDAE